VQIRVVGTADGHFFFGLWRYGFLNLAPKMLGKVLLGQLLEQDKTCTRPGGLFLPSPKELGIFEQGTTLDSDKLLSLDNCAMEHAIFVVGRFLRLCINKKFLCTISSFT